MPESELKTCPNCRDPGGAWRRACDCGWNFETQRQEHRPHLPKAESALADAGRANAPVPEENRDNAARRSCDFRLALAEYRHREIQDEDSEDREQLFFHGLLERYPDRTGRVAVAWLCVAALAFGVAGPLALAIVPLVWIGWNSFWMSKVRRQERVLVAHCARLRMSGNMRLAERLEQAIPLVRRAPGIVDDVLAHLGVID